jgi:hypothetical protein
MDDFHRRSGSDGTARWESNRGSIPFVVPATLALRIVGLLKVRRKEAPAMAGADRMTIEEVVKKVLLDEHADVIREAAKAVAAELMELRCPN